MVQYAEEKYQGSVGIRRTQTGLEGHRGGGELFEEVMSMLRPEGRTERLQPTTF